MLNRYLIGFGFCALFAIIYEAFAKGIISYWMLCMPLFPFFLGVVPMLVFEKLSTAPSDWALQIWNCGVITLTVGSTMNGIFEIFGTYFEFSELFLACGAILLLSGAAVHVVKSVK